VSRYSQYPDFERLIIHISDTHLLADGHTLYGSIDTEATVRDFLTRVVNQGAPVDALVFTGDLAERGEKGAYQALRDAVEPFAAALDAQVIWVMGNHDEREPFAEVFFGGASTSPQDRVYDLDGLRVIALDTSVPGYHHGELEPDQLVWLAQQLENPAPQGTLLAMHHPPIPSPNDIMGVIELEDQAALAAVIRGTDVRGVIAGHLHYSTFSTFAGVPVSVSAAACYAIDGLPDSTKILSALTTGTSASLVHVYSEQVVFSSVSFDSGSELAFQSADLRAEVAQMSATERRETLSSKLSDFNQEVDRKQAGA